jgi:putative peptidoglycan lipid II flippase
MMQINVFTDLFFASYIPAHRCRLRLCQSAGADAFRALSPTSSWCPFYPSLLALPRPKTGPNSKIAFVKVFMLTALTMLPLRGADYDVSAADCAGHLRTRSI